MKKNMSKIPKFIPIITLIFLIITGTALTFSSINFNESAQKILLNSIIIWQNNTREYFHLKLEQSQESEENDHKSKNNTCDANKLCDYPVSDNNVYTYNEMVDDLHSINQKYPEITEVFSLGKTIEQRQLWALKMGRGKHNVLVVGSAHAREWITTPLIIEQIKTYVKDYREGKNNPKEIEHFSLQNILQNYTIWFIPMLNPDGVTLVQKGPSAFPERKKELKKMNAPGFEDDFTCWKANIRGVDLNRQYNVQWKETMALAEMDSQRKVFTEPAWANYGGEKPESEPESRALAELIRKINFKLIIDYHATGNTLFWYYGQTGERLQRDKEVTGAVSNYSGYQMERSDINKEPNTTLVRWVVKEKEITGITIEVTSFTTEMRTMDDLPEALNNNRYLIPVAIDALNTFKKED